MKYVMLIYQGTTPLPGSDEHDWLYRAHLAGGTIRLDSKNPIDHRAARTYDQWLRVNYLVAYGDAAFAMKHLRCGDLGMLYKIGHRLLYMGAKTCLRCIQRDKNRRFDSAYTWRYWLGIWGSLKYPVDRKSRLFISRDHNAYGTPQVATRTN